LTRETRQWIELFRQTHRLEVDAFSGGARFERVALPTSGGVGDQPAKTMEALDVLEAVAFTVLMEQPKKEKRPGKKPGREQ